MELNQDNFKRNSDSILYQIRIKGHLGPGWSDWFDGLTIVQEDNGETILYGPIDQSALLGLLRKIRDLNMPIISLNSITDDIYTITSKKEINDE